MKNSEYMKCTLLSLLLTLKGSACSQDTGAPHDAGLIRSGKDSGTTSNINKISKTATAVAKAITTLSL